VAQIGTDLVLQGMPDNGDIPLTVNGLQATGTNVVAFGQGQHNLTMTLGDQGISFHLDHVPTGASCDATLTPLFLDCFESTGRGTITLDVNDTNCAAGVELDLASAGFDSAIVELDPPPYTTGTDIQTELVQLELGADTPLGPVVIRLRNDKPSLGRITNVEADGNGDFVRGDSFFDVFIEVELSGTMYHTGDTPFRLDAGTIFELPPLSSDYFPPPDAVPVKLFEVGGG